MKMRKLNLNARVSELDALSDAILGFFEKSALQGDAVLSRIFGELRSLSAEITEATKRDKTLSTLDEADDRRDAAFRDLSAAVSGLAKLPVPALRESAVEVKAILDKIGLGAAAKPYLEESAFLVKLLQDLDGKKDALSALPGVGEMVEALRQSQSEFDAAREAYDVAKSAEGKKACASSLKKPILALVNEKLLPYLSVAAENGGEWEALADFVSAEIARVNSRIEK